MAVTRETLATAALLAVNAIRKDMGLPALGALIPGRTNSPMANTIALSLRSEPYSAVVRLDRERITMYHGHDPVTGNPVRDYKMGRALCEFVRHVNVGNYPEYVDPSRFTGEW